MDSIRIVGAASTRWNDYVGTAAADDVDLLNESRSLYELADLDRSRWWIVAVDLAMHEMSPEVWVYAVQHGGTDVRFDVEDVLDADGRLPVTAFRLDQAPQVEAFLNEAFKRVAVRLVARGFRDETLVVREMVTGAPAAARAG